MSFVALFAAEEEEDVRGVVALLAPPPPIWLFMRSINDNAVGAPEIKLEVVGAVAVAALEALLAANTIAAGAARRFPFAAAVAGGLDAVANGAALLLGIALGGIADDVVGCFSSRTTSTAVVVLSSTSLSLS